MTIKSPSQLEKSSKDEHSMNSLFNFFKEKRLDDIAGGCRVQEPLLERKLTNEHKVHLCQGN